jgi:hypothetical protein
MLESSGFCYAMQHRSGGAGNLRGIPPIRRYRLICADLSACDRRRRRHSMRSKDSNSGGSGAKPEPSWLAGAAIGLTILGIASSAMAYGVGLALVQPTRRRP